MCNSLRGGSQNYALLRNRKQLKSVPAEPKGRILMSDTTVPIFLQPCHMTLVHLVRNTAITQQFQVQFRCTKIPSWSCYNAFLELKAPLGLGFKLTSLLIIALSESFTTLSNKSPSGAFFIKKGYTNPIKSQLRSHLVHQCLFL